MSKACKQVLLDEKGVLENRLAEVQAENELVVSARKLVLSRHEA